MRVILDALYVSNRSGTGRYAHELAVALAEQTEAGFLHVVWPEGHHVPDVIHHAADLTFNGNTVAARLWFEQWGIRQLFGRVRADLVHYPTGAGMLWGKTPFVITIHDLSFLHHPEWFTPGRARFYRAAIARSARRALRVVADSRATADDLVRLLEIPARRIDVIPLGVHPRFRPAEPAQCAWVRDAYRLPESFFLFVGTLEPRKNLGRLIRAWARVADHVPDLVVIGRQGWKMGAVRQLLQTVPCRERIHWTGHVADDDLPALYSAATAFVWPSLMEGFGLPPLEAMACGTPVLTSNTSSLPEVMGDAALLAPPEDEEALERAMLLLASDETLRVRLADAGRRRAAGFTWAHTARLTRESYLEALR